MKAANVCFIGLVFVVCAWAEPLLEGRVRLESGEPVADAQVRLFDYDRPAAGAVARAQTDGTGYFALPLAALRGRALPEGFALGPNYPNPFNPSTIIPYQLAASSQVRLEVFNLLGQRIATLVDGERPAGFHTATWYATDAAGRAVGAGVYIYRMTVGVEHQTGRMVLIDGQAGVSAGGIASVLPGASGVGGSHGEGEEYGLIVSGSGLVPYVDSAFRVEAGMAPVELVVSAGPHSAGKATDDDCLLCDLLNTQEEMEGGPDLIVEPPLMMSSSFVSPGDTFTLLVTVRNQGDSLATATTLRYYRSTDATISTRDTEVDTDAIDALAAAGTSAKFIRLTAPSSEGIYYYGACVRSVAGESNTDNNCSSSRAVRVWSESSSVTIPDANLRAAIEAVLGKARGATITAAEIARMNRLVANNVGISDLTGLEFATNLTFLQLDGNTIRDISSLASLTNLTFLQLWDNSITDLSSLASLTNLTQLNLLNNSITDLSPLASLTNLTFLQLSVNTIRDISSLSGLTNLRILGLSDNTIRDISSLASLTNLTQLYLGNNNISDLSPLASLTNLTFLRLEANNIRDISPLASLTNLTFLRLDGNNIRDISALASLTSLEEVRLRRNLLGASFVYEHIPALQARGVTVDFDPTPSTITITDDPTPVTIRDANLRAAIEAALGKARGAAITKGEMTALLTLEASEAGISDLAGLEFATNLTLLVLDSNNLSDISSLASLTNLRNLYLDDNNLSDISSLASLTNLTELYLGDNNLSDISSLASLTNLTHLQLAGNTIRDISSLPGLTNLAWLDLLGNPLSTSSINNHIPRLQDRRVDVQFNPNPSRGSDFDIELVFLDPFTDSEKDVFRIVARRWTSVITEDLPDYELTRGWSGQCGDQSFEIPAGERIDDLRIYVASLDDDAATTIAGQGGPHLLRDNTHLPVLGCIELAKGANDITILHEIGHVLGFGTVWNNLGFLQTPNTDTHFNGPRAIAAFNDAGGRNYAGAKVPVETDRAHWRNSVLWGDLMVPGGGGALSAITVQSLADLGYGVDVTQADAFTWDAAAKASAKIAAPATHAEPEWSCGTGQQQEPIYVVDPQGRIVRTISP